MSSPKDRLTAHVEIIGRTFRQAEPPKGTPEHDRWRDGVGRLRTLYRIAQELDGDAGDEPTTRDRRERSR